MVPVVTLFSTQHWKWEILALSQELRYENNVMDTIWDRKSFEVGGHWPLWRGWKNLMTTQNRQKSKAKNNGLHVWRFTPIIYFIHYICTFNEPRSLNVHFPVTAMCPPGYEQSECGKTCTQCRAGFYKTTWLNEQCVACPEQASFDPDEVGMRRRLQCYSKFYTTGCKKYSNLIPPLSNSSHHVTYDNI